MQPDVRQEPGLLRERLVAEGALEGLFARVEALVGLQMRGAAERLAALGAFKRPVPAVDYLVCHQVGGLVEELATGVASELPLLVVRGQVKGQVGGGDEGFGAQAAAVRVQAGAAVRAALMRPAAPRPAARAFGGAGCFVRTLPVRWGSSVVRTGVGLR